MTLCTVVIVCVYICTFLLEKVNMNIFIIVNLKKIYIYQSKIVTKFALTFFNFRLLKPSPSSNNKQNKVGEGIFPYF